MIIEYNNLDLSKYENNLIEKDTITKDFSDIYDRAEINQIEVETSHRNCGKASKLLKRAIELVDKSITLEVKIDNFPAIHLYEKFGFERKAIRKGYYNGIDGILMERNNEK